MSSAYTLHRDLSTPTAVDHTVTAHFTAADDTNLILIKHSILELHTLTLPDSRTADTTPRQQQQHQVCMPPQKALEAAQSSSDA
jgi:hypothetical protein